MSEARRLASRLGLAIYLSLAPSSVPPWRLTTEPPRLVLAVGEPTPGLAPRVDRPRR